MLDNRLTAQDWNLAIVATLSSGGLIAEVDRACRPLREVARHGRALGAEEVFSSWQRVVDQLVATAERQLATGQRCPAGRSYARAANYLINAERMQSRHWPGRRSTYERVLALMQLSFDLVDPRTNRVEVPYEGVFLPAYFTTATPTGRPRAAPAPCVIQWNGLNTTKEHLYFSGLAQELAARGVSTLAVDCPGSGEALRLRNLTARVDSEAWAAACVDYLQARPDVDTHAIGLVGWSLGGYFAARATAFEKRLKACVAWGANHNWGEVQRLRREREGVRPAGHYWDHVMWVWGVDDLDALLDLVADVHLDGVVEHITVPFLVTHGENDRQVPVSSAHRSYRQAVNSPRRELRVFTAAEGGAEYIGLDHLPLAMWFVADWVTETLRS